MSFLNIRQGRSLVLNSFSFLSSREQKKLMFITSVQIIASALDIVGVLALGLLANISLSQNGQYDAIPGQNEKEKALVLIAFACTLLVGRTIISFCITKYTFQVLSDKSAAISINLVENLVKNPNLVLRNSSLQDSLYSLTRGVEYITLQVLTSVILMTADFALLAFMLVTCFFLDPVISVILLVLFLGTAAILYRKLHKEVGASGQEASKLSISGNQDIVEIYGLYRELYVTKNLKIKTEKFADSRLKLSQINSFLNFTPYYSKYFIESAFVVFTLIIGSIQYMLNDLNSAITSIVIFLAAGSRLAPAVLRIQQGAIQLRGVVGLASPTFDLISKINFSKQNSFLTDVEVENFEDLKATIDLNSVSVSHDSGKSYGIKQINLNVLDGEFLAIVGPSGSGKTTLIDTILGLIQPTSGTVEIAGKLPQDAISVWPGLVSYVPQNVYVSNASLQENILFGRILNEVNLAKAIEHSGLSNFIKHAVNGIGTLVGESGVQLSGGERQKLGIARALYSNPKLLILDEATSSLDAISEKEISNSLEYLQGKTTIVVVAHRLSTIRKADKIIYLSDGRLISQGSFDDIRKDVPDFHTQAKLMGL